MTDKNKPTELDADDLDMAVGGTSKTVEHSGTVSGAEANKKYATPDSGSKHQAEEHAKLTPKTASDSTMQAAEAKKKHA